MSIRAHHLFSPSAPVSPIAPPPSPRERWAEAHRLARQMARGEGGDAVIAFLDGYRSEGTLDLMAWYLDQGYDLLDTRVDPQSRCMKRLEYIRTLRNISEDSPIPVWRVVLFLRVKQDPKRLP